ncbi:predicted protein [Chaetoceros tenuissimus]|uniref:MYND-type domain-containing protein n=1 Tax=Chaetoceros tenuissimus TaxID=426638 RepID=A0AAD3CF16_9STRA|nr:predicted protein [Chaetoceros tenuissimus]
MGKKSRRSNRKGRSSVQIPTADSLRQLNKEAFKSHDNRLYSEAVHKYEEGLEAIKIQSSNTIDLSILEIFKMKSTFSQNLIMMEYSRCGFDRVIQIYNDIQMSPENEKVPLSFMNKLQRQLAMLRLDSSSENKDQLKSLINDRISEGMKGYNDYDEMFSFLEAVRLLRNLKYYDEAITLGEKLERLDENGVGAEFENAVSHLERYRSGYHKQTDSRFPNNFLLPVKDACYKFENGNGKAECIRGDAYMIMVAQSNFLCHQIDNKQHSSQLCSNAIEHVERYLEWEWYLDRRCFTCLQKGTATEVQLVCSGCRFACYCSLDHQRMTWKKDAIQGMRIGHEILCPLMKAYRKWRLVSKEDNERALKLRRRLDRECAYFLSDGLGLKDKCFQERDVQEFLYSQNTCTLL